jgi:hypothetical protein
MGDPELVKVEIEAEFVFQDGDYKEQSTANFPTRRLLSTPPSFALNATKIGFFKKVPIAQPAKPAETAAAIIKVLEELGLVA